MTSQHTDNYSRRAFLQNNVLGVSALVMNSSCQKNSFAEKGELSSELIRDKFRPKTLNLSPARWIWYPSERVLPNTFILFR